MKNMKGDMNMSLYMFPLIQVAKSPPAPAVRVSQYRGIRPIKFFWGRGGGFTHLHMNDNRDTSSNVNSKR